MSVSAPENEHGLSTVNARTGSCIIAVATTPHPMRQRSTVLHELGHLLAGDLDTESSFTPGERTDKEIRADAFARHLLLPLDAVKRLGDGEISEALVSKLVQEFGASPPIVAIQLREAGLIDSTTCATWKSLSTPSLATRHGWLNQYRALSASSLLPRAPQRLMERAATAVQQGLLDVDEAADWYGLDAAELRVGLGIELSAHEPADPEDNYGVGVSLFGGATNS
nr:ImmA/IrrE family metallo-endopeptidase [Leucobacter exalbidus]